MWDKVLQFLNDNQDTLSWLFDALGWLFGSGVIIAIIGGIYKFAVWLLKEYRFRKIRTNENFPFKIIPPNSNVAKEILGGADDDPLADRNIPYQQRIQGRNTRREIEELIEDHRWLLIIGRTGLGKTREAVQVAQSLNNEGWSILYLTREGWLDAPAKLPINLPERKLLFFIDDLNKKCHSSNAEIRPDVTTSLTLPITEPFQIRLQRMLEAFDTFCGKSEIRVITTARNERASEFDEPSEWDKLGWTKYNSLWERFNLIDLPEADDHAEQRLLAETAEKADIYFNFDELANLAKRNDGTFRNLIENLYVAKTEGIPLSLENFRDTLNGTWQRRYQKAIKKNSNAKYIYDAIELIKETKIQIGFDTVIQVSLMISDVSLLRSLKMRREFYSALKNLSKTENILFPRDGQIEAKIYRINLDNYLPLLYKLFYFDWLSKDRKKLNAYITVPFLFIIPKSMFDPSKKINYLEKIICILFGLDNLILMLGIIYATYGFPLFCESIIRKLLEIQNEYKSYRHMNKSSISRTWEILGLVYQMMNRYDDALNSFEQAIRIHPKLLFSWEILGSNYRFRGLHDEGIAMYKRAIELDSKSPSIWNGLGNIYYDIGKYEDALQSYNKAIDINPQNAYVWWGNIGTLYQINNNLIDAITAYNKSIELNPNYVYSILSLAICYKKTGNEIEKEKLIATAELFLENQIDYVLACFQITKMNIEEGLNLLVRSLEKRQTSKIWAQKDPNFETIRDNERFKEIVRFEK